mmetsp:Transcript_6720/g.19417  ORF Transcript_6720/g.19417 Transcript_6720/m.19417 type:complete len:223 (-) Transcript_6720:1065-1733(-)
MLHLELDIELRSTHPQFIHLETHKIGNAVPPLIHRKQGRPIGYTRFDFLRPQLDLGEWQRFPQESGDQNSQPGLHKPNPRLFVGLCRTHYAKTQIIRIRNEKVGGSEEFVPVQGIRVVPSTNPGFGLLFLLCHVLFPQPINDFEPPAKLFVENLQCLSRNVCHGSHGRVRRCQHGSYLSSGLWTLSPNREAVTRIMGLCQHERPRPSPCFEHEKESAQQTRR